MSTAVLSTMPKFDHIRKLDLSRDLDQVADLIEICFPIHKDQDGQTYVREMRKAARDMRMMGWLNNLAEMGSQRASGFVWEQDGQIVGNLSLVPYQKDHSRIHLIANVAVHPDYRRQGIGRALTVHALTFLRRRGEKQTWLQVRDDNPGAIDLYHSVGFTDRFTRTTWRIRPSEFRAMPALRSPNLSIRRRRLADWKYQQHWLDTAYPHDIRWNLPVDFSRFTPGLLQGLENFLDGVNLRHWTVLDSGNCLGAVTWQKTKSFANNLWLAFPEATGNKILPDALNLVLRRLSRTHPLSIDYPKGWASQELTTMGFENFRTLIWMVRSLK